MFIQNIYITYANSLKLINEIYNSLHYKYSIHQLLCFVIKIQNTDTK
jgi:hypothetical protein